MASRDVKKYLDEFEKMQQKNPKFGLFNCLDYYHLRQIADGREDETIKGMCFGFMAGYKAGIRAARKTRIRKGV